jgi:hypothetical protein
MKTEIAPNTVSSMGFSYPLDSEEGDNFNLVISRSGMTGFKKMMYLEKLNTETQKYEEVFIHEHLPFLSGYKYVVPPEQAKTFLGDVKDFYSIEEFMSKLFFKMKKSWD